MASGPVSVKARASLMKDSDLPMVTFLWVRAKPLVTFSHGGTFFHEPVLLMVPAPTPILPKKKNQKKPTNKQAKKPNRF
jgi:hypothetical protein